VWTFLALNFLLLSQIQLNLIFNKIKRNKHKPDQIKFQEDDDDGESGCLRWVRTHGSRDLLNLNFFVENKKEYPHLRGLRHSAPHTSCGVPRTRIARTRAREL